MKKLFKLGPGIAWMFASVWLLGGCYYDPYAPNYGGGFTPGIGNPGFGQNNANNAYNIGMSYGRRDASRGLARQASRHWHVVPGVQRETFAHGYNAGYQQGGGQGTGQQAYSQGFGFGRSDARRGLPRQASRHWNAVPAVHRRTFAEGYNAGYVRN